MENKQHWYDGYIYDTFIAPNQSELFGAIRGLMPDGSSVIDIGFGTGHFLLQSHEQLSEGVGIDLSAKNVAVAQRSLEKSDANNITFHHHNAMKLEEILNKRYDFAMMTYVIHEMPEALRVPLLRKLTAHAEKIILAEYRYPRPKKPISVINELVEFFAGTDHYRNFKSFMRGGGAKGLVEKAGLRIEQEIEDGPFGSEIIVIS